MALRPGTNVSVIETPPSRSVPTDTGTAFMAGLCDKGSVTEPIAIRSLDDFVNKCGGRVSYSVLYDVVDAFFHSGGNMVWISRIVGPAPVSATRNLVDATPATSLVVTAKSPGTWGNSIKVGVVAGGAGGTFQIQVTDTNNVVLEQSPDLTTQADAAAWSQNSTYVTITIGGGGVPVVGGANVITVLAAGADDRASITDTQRLAALNRFVKDMGPGQVAMPGFTTDTVHQMLLDHAAANNRDAVLGAPDSPTNSTLISSATNAKTTLHGRSGGVFWPWIIIPGITSAPGTTRTVPPEGHVMGRMAAVDASDGPNIPAAGDKGILTYCLGLSQPPKDDLTRDTLNKAGVNVIRSVYGQYQIYGYRSLADPVNDPDWLDLANVRLIMAIKAECDVVAQSFVFDQIDGFGHKIAEFAGAVTAVPKRYYESGQLYGAVASEAYVVDVGSTVNTPATIADRQLNAAVGVRPSPDAELVTIRISNVPITKAVA